MTTQLETDRESWFDDDPDRDRREECIALALALDRKRQHKLKRWMSRR